MYAEFQNESRGYQVCVEVDLLGFYVLHRRWYGLRNKRGGYKQQLFTDRDDALKEFKRVERLRVRRGYALKFDIKD